MNGLLTEGRANDCSLLLTGQSKTLPPPLGFAQKCSLLD